MYFKPVEFWKYILVIIYMRTYMGCTAVAKLTNISSFQLVACHAFDKLTNVTRCSKRAMATATTKSDPTLDVINSSTFYVQEIKVALSSFSRLVHTHFLQDLQICHFLHVKFIPTLVCSSIHTIGSHKNTEKLLPLKDFLLIIRCFRGKMNSTSHGLLL